MELPIKNPGYQQVIAEGGDILTQACHGQSAAMGWWQDLDEVLALPGMTDDMKAKVTMWYQATKLMLSVSELAEAMEGLRKGKMDDHLPQHTMVAAELADSSIRNFDLAGAMGINLGVVISEKLLYNASRADHQPEARAAEGGKKF